MKIIIKGKFTINSDMALMPKEYYKLLVLEIGQGTRYIQTQPYSIKKRKREKK